MCQYGPQAFSIIFIFIASFIEEFINRGLMVNGLKIILKRNWLIILIVAILFGLGHTANPIYSLTASF